MSQEPTVEHAFGVALFKHSIPHEDRVLYQKDFEHVRQTKKDYGYPKSDGSVGTVTQAVTKTDTRSFNRILMDYWNNFYEAYSLLYPDVNSMERHEAYVLTQELIKGIKEYGCIHDGPMDHCPLYRVYRFINTDTKFKGTLSFENFKLDIKVGPGDTVVVPAGWMHAHTLTVEKGVANVVHFTPMFVWGG